MGPSFEGGRTQNFPEKKKLICNYEKYLHLLPSFNSNLIKENETNCILLSSSWPIKGLKSNKREERYKSPSEIYTNFHTKMRVSELLKIAFFSRRLSETSPCEKRKRLTREGEEKRRRKRKRGRRRRRKGERERR